MGREAGGTHFVCLDADETFTNPLIDNFKELLPQLQPGEKNGTTVVKHYGKVILTIGTILLPGV